MANSVLNGCGRYSEKLIEISESIIEKRTRNGEKTSENDIWEIDSQIFEAYQTILGTAKDSNVIAKSIEYLKESVERSGSISDINNLAISSVQKSIQEENILLENEEKTSKVLGNVAAVTITANVIQDGTKILDNIFDENTLKEIDVQIEKAQSGDEKAAGEMSTYQSALAFLAKNPVLDEKSQRGALGWMKRLEALDSPVAEKLVKDMAMQYKFDILEKTEDGEIVVSKEKFDKLYEDKISVVNPRMAKIGNKYYKELNEKSGKKAIEEGKFEGKTSEDFAKQVRKKLEEPQKAYLEELIEKYNKMQEKGVNPEKIMDVQRKISVMSTIVKEKTQENSKKIDNSSNIVNKEKEDDEFVLE